MKIVLDITKLVEDGELTPEQAEKLKNLAAKETGDPQRVRINCRGR